MNLPSQRYEEWYATPAGAFAFERTRALMGRLISAWPRRGSTLLGMNVGSGLFLEALWEAGFDVTGQERDPVLLTRARERLGHRADFVAAAPSHLPFDNESFDYVVAVAALEFAFDTTDVLREMARLARRGMLIVFPNIFSLYYLECRVLPLILERSGRKRKSAEASQEEEGASAGPACLAQGQSWFNPLKLRRLTREVAAGKHTAWSSVLLGPSRTWKPGGILNRINRSLPGLPFGAFAGLRIDFGPLITSTAMPLTAAPPAAPVAR